MLGYGLWHQSCGWPWETCTGDDCQDSRWKKFGLMHGCASPSLFCSVFIWRGGFAPSLRCNGTVFLVYLKCFLTVVLEQGRHGEGMPLCSYEACGIALIFQMHSNADNMLFGYVSHIDCKCMPMQCHRCNHICSVISTHSLSWTTTIVWNWSMEMYHIWLYITGVFADFAPRTLMREGSETPRNEARRIRETILSVMDAADMAVILDTGSSDGTQNIIKQATWQNSAFPHFLETYFLADSFNLTYWRVRGSL